MTAIISGWESSEQNRTFRIDARGTSPTFLEHVFVSIPCDSAECGEHVLRLERDELVAMVKSELRLIEPEVGSFELTEADLSLLAR